MSARAITRTVLECDGCGSRIGTAAEYENVMEARASAYNLGWRFPNKVNTDGKVMKHISDVCPACLPQWNPAVLKAQKWTQDQHEHMRRMRQVRAERGEA